MCSVSSTMCLSFHTSCSLHFSIFHVFVGASSLRSKFACVLTAAESIMPSVYHLYFECCFSCGDMESMSEMLFCLTFRFCFFFSSQFCSICIVFHSVGFSAYV